MTATRWVGHCHGCRRYDREVEARNDTHAAKTLCDDCAAKPHRLPSGDGLEGNSPAHTTLPKSGRYDGRILDVRGLLAQPDEPIPWRCDNLAADGYLSVLAGRGG